MNRSIKLLLTLIGGLVVLCLCAAGSGWLLLRTTGWAITEVVESDPATVARVSDGIADYTLPTGFDDGYAVDIADYSLVSYTAGDGRMHLYLIQGPPHLNVERAELERQIGDATGGNDWTEVSVVSRQPCQIRGEASELVISEGVSHDGQAYRSASAMFTGNGGPALVNISGPAASWDQAMVDAFIASLN